MTCQKMYKFHDIPETVVSNKCELSRSQQAFKPPHLSELVPVLRLQVALHIRHELIQARCQVRLAVSRLRRNNAPPQLTINLHG